MSFFIYFPILVGCVITLLSVQEKQRDAFGKLLILVSLLYFKFSLLFIGVHFDEGGYIVGSDTRLNYIHAYILFFAGSLIAYKLITRFQNTRIGHTNRTWDLAASIFFASAFVSIVGYIF